MITNILLSFVLTLVAGTIGLHIRDGQNDHKAITSVGKWFHYAWAAITFVVVMWMQFLTLSS